ncbi:major facilitator superfamily domain-containing protein [Lipomyces oligophaga]|uniref:major facilitator superfamily domain-containing protein n=1 Tax=Lipomyces oligophaga TaxID=45792 RepID=UPI0034CE2501
MSGLDPSSSSSSVCSASSSSLESPITTPMTAAVRSSSVSGRTLIDGSSFMEVPMDDPEKVFMDHELDPIRTTHYETFTLAQPVLLPQDEGLYPWLAVLGGFCAQYCSFGMMNMIGNFIAYYESHQLVEYSSSAISWIGSIQSGVFCLAAPVCSQLVNMYGSRAVTIPGAILITAGLLGTAFSTLYFEFIICQGIICALGAAGLFYPSIYSLSTWFADRRGVAFGIASVGSCVGGTTMPFLLNTLFQKSFESGVGAMAAIFAVLGAITAGTVTLRYAPTGRKPIHFVKTFVHPLRDVNYSLFVCSMFFIYLGIFVPMGFLPSTSIHYGMSSTFAFHLTAYMNVGSLIGRLICGVLFDHFSKFTVFTFYVLLSGLVVIPGWYLASSSSAAIIAITVLYGFGSGGILSTFNILVGCLSPSPDQISSRIGTCSAIIAVSSTVALPIAGAIIGIASDSDAGYHGMQAYAGAVMLAGALIVTCVRFRLHHAQ